MALILSGDTGVPASGMPTGSVIQTVNGTYSSQVNTSSTTYVDTGLTATITPLFATSKILIMVDHADVYSPTGGVGVKIQLFFDEETKFNLLEFEKLDKIKKIDFTENANKILHLLTFQSPIYIS
jgi:hypothetical protein